MLLNRFMEYSVTARRISSSPHITFAHANWCSAPISDEGQCVSAEAVCTAKLSLEGDLTGL